MQALVDALLHVRGVATHADATLGAGRIGDDAELRREGDLVAAVREQPGDQPFVVARTVDVGGVDERDADVHGVMQRGQRLGVVDGAAVHGRQRHPAESQSADGQIVAQQGRA